MLIEDRRVDVVGTGRAERHDFQIGQARAHPLGEPIEPDYRRLVARKVCDQGVFAERSAVGAKFRARVERFEFGFQLGKEIEVGGGDRDTGHRSFLRCGGKCR